MTDQDHFDHRRPQGGPRTHYGRSPRRPMGPMVRWSSLATGSLVGIGTWALAYAVGATLWLALGGADAQPALWLRAALGGYGALSASLALALAARTAARTGGAQTEENALLYGLCLWSMSTITLVVVAMLATSGVLPTDLARSAPIFAVGFAAIGLASEAGAAAGTTWQSMAAVVATLVVSLLIAVWGGLKGRCREG